MTIVQILLKEMEREAATTRKMLSIVPTEKFDYKPHEKSMSLKQLATHVAELTSWVTLILNTSELDFLENPYDPKELANTQELVNYFEACLQQAKERLATATEEDFQLDWTLRSGETIHVVESKGDNIRMCYCQIVHHRAQLGVYLRLLNIPIPGSYGPSADEMGM